MSKVFLYHSPTYFWDILSLTLERAPLDRLIDQQAPINYLSLCLQPQYWGNILSDLYMGPRDPNSGHYPRNTFSGPSPSPHRHCLKKHRLASNSVVAEGDLEILISPLTPTSPQLSRCCACRHTLPHLACFLIFTSAFFKLYKHDLNLS